MPLQQKIQILENKYHFDIDIEKVAKYGNLFCFKTEDFIHKKGTKDQSQAP